VPYLLIADIQNTVLSAILVFSDRVLYPSYSVVPRLFGLSALEDQVAAGAIMWVVGSLAFVVPAVIIAVQCLSRKSARPAPAAVRERDKYLDVGLPPVSQTIAFAPRLLRAQSARKKLEAVSFLVLFVASGVCLARFLATSGDDDDQALRFAGASGSITVAVFAPAGDLVAGPSPFSVLVQDSSSREVLLDATIELRAHPAAGLQPASTMAHAGYQDSQNKLLQSAELNLSTAGDWTVEVMVRRNSQTAEFSMPLQVVKGDAGIGVLWPYAVLLALAFVLLLAYIRRHRAPKTFTSLSRVA